MTESLPKSVLIGTAGHIDHGKTRLVERLTGIDTDRLPEEQARGISIDLGFAHTHLGGLCAGFVDVPGHERFVRNMVAGAGGIDVALLVVAADDGVMPQTREHLEILQLLGVSRGLVAITKIDLVEADLVELVAEEVRELTQGTFLEGARQMRVSSQTGAGVEELRNALERLCAELTWEPPRGPFRLPVDRVFSLSGRGTIVTGTARGGSAQTGESLMVYPAQCEVRVRSVQSHGQDLEQSGPHRRTALNLAGIKSDELRRGDVVADAGSLSPMRRLIVRLKNLSSPPVEFSTRRTLQLHLGTAEVPARLRVYGAPIPPGGTGYGELRTALPVVAVWGERFLLRRRTTLGGGTILDPAWPEAKRLREADEYTAGLDDHDAATRLKTLLDRDETLLARPALLFARCGVATDEIPALLDQLRERGELVEGVFPLTRVRHEALRRGVLRILEAELDRAAPRRTLPRAQVVAACEPLASRELLGMLLDALAVDGRLVVRGDRLGPADRQPKFTKRQRDWYRAALDAIATGGAAPPTFAELCEQLGAMEADLRPLFANAVEDGLLLELAPGFYWTPDAIDRCREQLAARFQETPTLRLTEIRELWGITRKHAVPLAEAFDRLGYTIREGETRRAGEGLVGTEPRTRS